MNSADFSAQFIHKVTSNVHYISGLTGHVKEVVISCYADGLKRTHSKLECPSPFYVSC